MRRSAHLTCNSLAFHIEGRQLFHDLNLSLGEGARLGIIGENGSGKSTLLVILAGELDPSAGEVAVSARSAYVPQHLDLLRSDKTIGEEIEASLSFIQRIERDLEESALELAQGVEGAAERYAAALQVAQEIDIWAVAPRVERSLDGLGLDKFPKTPL